MIIAEVNTRFPRYIKVLKDYDDLKVVEVGMWEKNGAVMCTSNGNKLIGPRIYFEVDGEVNNKPMSGYGFDELVGWSVVCAHYTAYTLLVVLAKDLYK